MLAASVETWFECVIFAFHINPMCVGVNFVYFDNLSI